MRLVFRRGASGTTATARHALAHPEVRKLWVATLASSLAVWIAQVALVVGVLEHHAGSSLAWVLLASSLPALLAGIAAGTVVDRHDPRRVAQLTGIAGVILLATAGVGLTESLAAGAAGYALFLITGCLTGPARLRLLYAALPPDQRAAGNAALGTASGITTVVGAAIGGVGVATLGVLPAFLLAAAVQAVAAAALLALAPVSRQPGSTGIARPGFGRALAEGVTAIRGYPLAVSIIVVGIAWGLIGGGYDVLIGIYGTHLLHGGGGVAVGLLYAADGIGVIAGSLLAARLPVRRQRQWYALGYGLQGALWAVFSLGRSLPEAIPALLAMRVASGVIIALDTTLLLATVPDKLHGRAYALHTTTYGVVSQASLAVTGIALLAVSAQAVTLGAGLASVVVGALWWLTVRRAPWHP